MVRICDAALKSQGSFELDWSYAGINAGERRTAYRPSRRCNVKDYGAAMDGTSDDRDAVQAAVEACGRAGGGSVEIPAGTLRLEGQVKIRYSNVILRGAGREQTTIYIPHSLEYYNRKPRSNKTSSAHIYSRSKGFLEIIGLRNRRDRNSYLSSVTASSPAGSQELNLKDASKIFPGQWIRLHMSDPKDGPAERSLVGHMYSNPETTAQCGSSCLSGLRGEKDVIRFMSRVQSVDGDVITLSRQLPVDVNPAWKPVVYSILDEQVVQDSGIQDLTVEFGWKRTKPHLMEAGHNAVMLEETVFCWVKNVAVVNADVNFLVRHSNFATVTEVNARVTKDRSLKGCGGKQGHIGIAIHDSSDVLVSNFNIEDRWGHDLSTRNSQLSVFRQGRGMDLNMDLHRNAPYMMLYEDIHLGEGARPFTTGGKDASGMPTAGYSTFVNIRSFEGRPILLPGCKYGPNLNFFGSFRRGKGMRSCKGWSVSDTVNRGGLYGN